MALRFGAIGVEIMGGDPRANAVAGAETGPEAGAHDFLRDDRPMRGRAAAAATFGGDARSEQPRRPGAAPGVAIDDALGFPAFSMRQELARDEFGGLVGEKRELVVHPRRTLHIESFNLLDSKINSDKEESSGRCAKRAATHPPAATRSEEHTSELQSLMRISYAVFCLKKKK